MKNKVVIPQYQYHFKNVSSGVRGYNLTSFVLKLCIFLLINKDMSGVEAQCVGASTPLSETMFLRKKMIVFLVK